MTTRTKDHADQYGTDGSPYFAGWIEESHKTAKNDIDKIVNNLHQHKNDWVRLSISNRIAILETIIEDLVSIRESWVEAELLAKELPLGSGGEAEEWVILATAFRLINKLRQSLVEIALILPALVILFLGIAEVGFYLFAHVQVANAARAGTRHGTLCRVADTCADLANVVADGVFDEATNLLNGTNTSVDVLPNPVPIPLAAGTPITVTVTYTHTPPFVSNFVPMFPAQLSVQHRVIMRINN